MEVLKEALTKKSAIDWKEEDIVAKSTQLKLMMKTL